MTMTVSMTMTVNAARSTERFRPYSSRPYSSRPYRYQPRRKGFHGSA